jgi:hypothetical protein
MINDVLVDVAILMHGEIAKPHHCFKRLAISRLAGARG